MPWMDDGRMTMRSLRMLMTKMMMDHEISPAIAKNKPFIIIILPSPQLLYVARNKQWKKEQFDKIRKNYLEREKKKHLQHTTIIRRSGVAVDFQALRFGRFRNAIDVIVDAIRRRCRRRRIHRAGIGAVGRGNRIAGSIGTIDAGGGGRGRRFRRRGLVRLSLPPDETGNVVNGAGRNGRRRRREGG